jgi:hypothetical protein
MKAQRNGDKFICVGISSWLDQAYRDAMGRILLHDLDAIGFTEC